MAQKRLRTSYRRVRLVSHSPIIIYFLWLFRSVYLRNIVDLLSRLFEFDLQNSDVASSPFDLSCMAQLGSERRVQSVPRARLRATQTTPLSNPLTLAPQGCGASTSTGEECGARAWPAGC